MKRSAAWCLAAAFVLGMTLGVSGKSDEKDMDIEKDIVRLLVKSGAVSYAQKKPYGAGIVSMTIGYDEDSKPVIAVAVRETKTYKRAMVIVAVTRDKDGYKITAAEIPDVGTFHGKSQSLARDALKDITGKVFKNKKEALGLADAVTGATKYYRAIYVSYALMASRAIEEMSASPDWPRRPMQP
ncbi:MAG: hypothetical protein JXN60_09300 [Lentisphaerae bacterium]|nr:hypothetical protein [Lentisphaerota bacterium]